MDFPIFPIALDVWLKFVDAHLGEVSGSQLKTAVLVDMHKIESELHNHYEVKADDLTDVVKCAAFYEAMAVHLLKQVKFLQFEKRLDDLIKAGVKKDLKGGQSPV